MQARQKEHGGCTMGRILSTSCYSPFQRLRWESGKVSKMEPLANMDALKALQICSPRFPVAKPFPTVAPIKPEWFPEETFKAHKRPRTVSNSISSQLPQDVQIEVTQLITTAMQKQRFKLDSEEAVAQPQFNSIKQQANGILAAGNFFCKVAGSYHSTSTSFFLLWPDGRLVQKCHNTQCSGQKVDCGVWQLPPETEKLLCKKK